MKPEAAGRFFACASRWRGVLAALGFLLAAVAGAAAPAYEIAVIPKGTTHEYWQAMHAGAVKAQREFAAEGVAVDLIWKGPLREDDREQQIQVVENFIARRVSGLVLAPLDEKALVAPVEEAAAAGIPVVIVDSALATDRIAGFAATDNYAGGRLGARRLAHLLGGRGRIILLRVMTGSASTEAREAGFLDTITKEFPQIQVLSSDQHAGPTRDTAYRAAQNLLNRYGREVDGIFTPNESTTVGMLLALRDLGLAGGRVKLVGFDTGQQEIAALADGDLQGLVVQNPFRMGYLGVKLVVDRLRGRPGPARVDTGVALVTPETMRDPALAELLHPPLAEYLR